MSNAAAMEISAQQVQDVRFIGSVAGRYVLPDRRAAHDGVAPVLACRLRSISTRQFVCVAPVIGRPKEFISANFEHFGLLEGEVVRSLPTGMAVELKLDEAQRIKLGAQIAWKKSRALAKQPERREGTRILPRQPRTDLILADGSRLPCMVINVSPTGAGVSADLSPVLGTPVAVGKMVGRVVRRQPVAARSTAAQLDLTGLPTGLYTVRCGTATGKLVVE